MILQTPDKIEIPRTEDKKNEFKEFYQYGRGLEALAANLSQNSKAVQEIKLKTRTEVARAVCSFGNDPVGGFVILGDKLGRRGNGAGKG